MTPFDDFRQDACRINTGTIQVSIAFIDQQIAMKTGTGSGKGEIYTIELRIIKQC